MQVLTNKQVLHREYLKSPLWKDIRQKALLHYGAICNRCGVHATDVHHKSYDRAGGNELLSDLEILCRDCHQTHHNLEKKLLNNKQFSKKGVNRRAIFNYLSNKQISYLVNTFNLVSKNDLYAKIRFGDKKYANKATKILGFDYFYEKKPNLKRKVSSPYPKDYHKLKFRKIHEVF